MSEIPRNRKVRTKKDLQNVITGVILRWDCTSFTIEDVCDKLEEYIKFSTYGKNGKGRKSVNIKAIIEDTLNLLSTYSVIRYDTKVNKYKLQPLH